MTTIFHDGSPGPVLGTQPARLRLSVRVIAWEAELRATLGERARMQP